MQSQVQTWDAIADSLPDLITCSEVLRYESYRFRNYPGSSSNFVQSLKEKVEMFNIVTFCLSFYVDICLDWYAAANLTMSHCCNLFLFFSVCLSCANS